MYERRCVHSVVKIVKAEHAITLRCAAAFERQEDMLEAKIAGGGFR
jgi:hypothetical protein